MKTIRRFNHFVKVKVTLFWLMSFGLIACSKNEAEPKIPPIGEIDATINGQKFPIWGSITQVEALLDKEKETAFGISVWTFSKEGYVRMTGMGLNLENTELNTQILSISNLIDTSGNYIPREIPSGFSIHSEDGDAGYASYDLDSRYENSYTITSISESEIIGSFTLHYRKVSGFQHPQFEDKYEVVCKRFVAKRRYPF